MVDIYAADCSNKTFNNLFHCATDEMLRDVFQKNFSCCTMFQVIKAIRKYVKVMLIIIVVLIPTFWAKLIIDVTYFYWLLTDSIIIVGQLRLLIIH